MVFFWQVAYFQGLVLVFLSGFGFFLLILGRLVGFGRGVLGSVCALECVHVFDPVGFLCAFRCDVVLVCGFWGLYVFLCAFFWCYGEFVVSLCSCVGFRGFVVSVCVLM